MRLDKKISGKIARIRLEPEHIRLRYVWGSVGISMLIIFAIWIFSLGSLFQGEKNASNQEASKVPGITEQLQTLKEQAPSIKDFAEQLPDTANEGIVNSQNAADFQYSPTSNTENPQASAYSDLPTTTPAQ